MGQVPVARRDRPGAREQDLLHRARAEDVLHWQLHHRPISAETLRKRLHIGAGAARSLVTQLRTDTKATLDTLAEPAAQRSSLTPSSTQGGPRGGSAS